MRLARRKIVKAGDDTEVRFAGRRGQVALRATDRWGPRTVGSGLRVWDDRMRPGRGRAPASALSTPRFGSTALYRWMDIFRG